MISVFFPLCSDSSAAADGERTEIQNQVVQVTFQTFSITFLSVSVRDTVCIFLQRTDFARNVFK